MLEELLDGGPDVEVGLDLFVGRHHRRSPALEVLDQAVDQNHGLGATLGIKAGKVEQGALLKKRFNLAELMHYNCKRYV